jgi:hypothetical protein
MFGFVGCAGAGYLKKGQLSSKMAMKIIGKSRSKRYNELNG